MEGKKFYYQVGGLALVIILGVVSGWGLALYRQKGKSEPGQPIAEQPIKGQVRVGQTYGQQDGVFKDQAVGVLAKNDEKGSEGTHKLLREGGPSQTVYLTSSVLDLDQFVGHKIQVWGETFSSQKVAWLMDVGRVKVLQ